MITRCKTFYSRVRRALSDQMLAEFRRPWVQAYDIRSVLDVGANIGQFAAIARAAFPLARIMSFEPLPDCYERLTSRFAGDERFSALRAAVGATSGQMTMYRSSFSPSSSLLRMGDRHREAFPSTAELSPTQVDVVLLDRVHEVSALPAPLFLKVDVQGYERAVLNGATETLKRTALVMVEASLEELYETEVLLPELLAIMNEARFRFVGFAGMTRHPRSGRQLQLDALFERMS